MRDAGDTDPAMQADSLADLLERSARRWPLLPALARGAQVVADYATLRRRVGALAQWLCSAGLAPGDRVALVSRNVPAYVEALFACWWAGLVAVPVNARLHPRELAFVLADSGAALALVDDAWMAALAAGEGELPTTLPATVLGGADWEAAAARPDGSRSPSSPRNRQRGCSTPAAPPGGPRAWCFRMPTSSP